MADGRRSDGHDAELLRSVFVILSGALAFIVGVLLFWKLRRIVGLIVIAAFFATILNPLVDALTRLKMRRGVATSIVFLLGVAAFAGLVYTFVRPIYDAGQSFARDIPGFVERARNGEGRVGELIKQLQHRREGGGERPQAAERAEQRRRPGGADGAAGGLGPAGPAHDHGPVVPDAAGGARHHRRLPVRCSRPDMRCRCAGSARTWPGPSPATWPATSLISVIAGTVTWIFLTIVDVPFAGVLGLWVGFADLLPLVGATIGAIPTIAIAFLHSTGSGIAMVIFYIVYQQIENHILQPVVMSRTVHLNPLLVLLSVLVGVELAGFVGALLAIPAAGAIQVVVRDLWDERQQRLKPVPTVGADETPITDLR